MQVNHPSHLNLNLCPVFPYLFKDDRYNCIYRILLNDRLIPHTWPPKPLFATVSINLPTLQEPWQHRWAWPPSWQRSRPWPSGPGRDPCLKACKGRENFESGKNQKHVGNKFVRMIFLIQNHLTTYPMRGLPQPFVDGALIIMTLC